MEGPNSIVTPVMNKLEKRRKRIDMDKTCNNNVEERFERISGCKRER